MKLDWMIFDWFFFLLLFQYANTHMSKCIFYYMRIADVSVNGNFNKSNINESNCKSEFYAHVERLFGILE